MLISYWSSDVCSSDLHRTLALQDAFAASPSTAFADVLHSMVLSTFYHGRTESCLGVSVQRTSFPNQAPGMKDSHSARSIAATRKSVATVTSVSIPVVLGGLRLLTKKKNNNQTI